MSESDGLQQLNLNLHPNEASGLLTVADEALLESHGWDVAFWVVMDEGEIEDCIGIIGHRRGADISEGWGIDRFHCETVGDKKKTEDAEAVTRRDGWIYAFGSHFGSKSGPLEPKRSFIARFQEAEVKHAFEDPVVDLEVSRKSFVLHRIINDAFKARAAPDLIPLGPATSEGLIEATIKRGKKEKKQWDGLVREGDYPLNFEGAAFRENGALLLGLRFPTAADGRPVLVEVENIDGLFESRGSLPTVVGFWVVDAVGRDGNMAGVRDLATVFTEAGEELHLVTGNVDSKKGGSVLIKDYKIGRDTVASHFRCVLPEGEHSGFLEAEFVREFPSLPRVEGIAITDDERFFYVTDEDEGVHLRLTRLLAQ